MADVNNGYYNVVINSAFAKLIDENTFESFFKPNNLTASSDGLVSFLQELHNLRTNLCEMIDFKLDESKNDSIPISLNLVIAPTALLVWTVESTR